MNNYFERFVFVFDVIISTFLRRTSENIYDLSQYV